MIPYSIISLTSKKMKSRISSLIGLQHQKQSTAKSKVNTQTITQASWFQWTDQSHSCARTRRKSCRHWFKSWKSRAKKGNAFALVKNWKTRYGMKCRSEWDSPTSNTVTQCTVIISMSLNIWWILFNCRESSKMTLLSVCTRSATTNFTNDNTMIFTHKKLKHTHKQNLNTPY